MLKQVLKFIVWAYAVTFVLVGAFIFLNPKLFFSFFGSYYGDFNIHFLKDAGIAFFCSGVILFWGALKEYDSNLLIAGSIFALFHSIFHLTMIVSGMVPNSHLLFEIFLNGLSGVFLLTVVLRLKSLLKI